MAITSLSPLLALINDKGFVTNCNVAFTKSFRTQPGHMLQKDFHSLIRIKIKRNSFIPCEQTITFAYCPAILRRRPLQIFLNHLKGSKLIPGGLWLLQATPASNHNARRLFPQFGDLSSREREICHLVREGSKNREIAIKLCISPHTVNQHFKSIHRKFGTHSRPELVYVLNQLPKESCIENFKW